MDVLVYDSSGNPVSSIFVDDTIRYVDGRVSKGERFYYKGLGVPYKTHHHLNPSSEYEVIRESGVFYLGKIVTKRCFVGKTGIFQELYQPFFPDFIGSCGNKEGTVVLNAMSFERSSIDVIDCVRYDIENDQYYYVVNYLCGRKKYLSFGCPLSLYQLLEYMIQEDWNFLWDKGSINDISFDGRVSDTADIFISKEVKHKLGTIYSVLYSLYRSDLKKYHQFCKTYNLRSNDLSDVIFNVVELLKRFGVLIELDTKDPQEQYKTLVKDYLLEGKNCAYCSCDLYQDAGDTVKAHYQSLIKF